MLIWNARLTCSATHWRHVSVTSMDTTKLETIQEAEKKWKSYRWLDNTTQVSEIQEKLCEYIIGKCQFQHEVPTLMNSTSL